MWFPFNMLLYCLNYRFIYHEETVSWGNYTESLKLSPQATRLLRTTSCTREHQHLADKLPVRPSTEYAQAVAELNTSPIPTVQKAWTAFLIMTKRLNLIKFQVFQSLLPARTPDIETGCPVGSEIQLAVLVEKEIAAMGMNYKNWAWSSWHEKDLNCKSTSEEISVFEKRFKSGEFECFRSLLGWL